MGNRLKKGYGYWKGSRYISRSNTGYWSKYGGGKFYKNTLEPDANWFCQSCGEEQFSILPSYLVKTEENEYIKVCVFCRFKLLKYDIENLEDLIVIVHKPDSLARIANLLTIPIRY